MSAHNCVHAASYITHFQWFLSLSTRSGLSLNHFYVLRVILPPQAPRVSCGHPWDHEVRLRGGSVLSTPSNVPSDVMVNVRPARGIMRVSPSHWPGMRAAFSYVRNSGASASRTNVCGRRSRRHPQHGTKNVKYSSYTTDDVGQCVPQGAQTSHASVSSIPASIYHVPKEKVKTLIIHGVYIHFFSVQLLYCRTRSPAKTVLMGF